MISSIFSLSNLLEWLIVHLLSCIGFKSDNSGTAKVGEEVQDMVWGRDALSRFLPSPNLKALLTLLFGGFMKFITQAGLSKALATGDQAQFSSSSLLRRAVVGASFSHIIESPSLMLSRGHQESPHSHRTQV